MTEPSVIPEASRTRSGGFFRWVIVSLLFFATLINYMDRQVLALLKPQLSQSLKLSDVDYGKINSAFQAAYAAGQLLAGPFIESIGTKGAYSIAIILWSVAAMAHAGVRSALGFGSARFALGVGESVSFPASIKTVAEWTPQRERSVATGIFNCGTSLGAIIAPLIVPIVTDHFGWQGAFLGIGAAGFIWLFFWLALYAQPRKSRWLHSAELSHIESGKGPPAVEKIAWIKLLKYRQTWAYIATGILVGPVWWFYLSWLPDFFNKQFKLDLKSFGPPLVVVYAMASFGGIGGGGLSAWLLKRGWTLNAARKTTALVCACLPIPVIFTTHTSNVWLATGLLALAVCAHQGWSATMYTVVSDIFPNRAVASVVGLGGTFAAIASTAIFWIIGLVLQSKDSYGAIMPFCAGAYLMALLIFHLAVPRLEPVAIE
jgi:MFS transporter, ACS family, hexuronate transporter